MDRKAMYKLSYGLFVLTAREDEKDNGCIINTAIQAASEPNQLSICVNKANYTHDMIQRTGKFHRTLYILHGNDFSMYKLSYGLFILTAKEAEKDNGCIINTDIQAASEPNQLSICVNKANYTHDMIKRTGKHGRTCQRFPSGTGQDYGTG